MTGKANIVELIERTRKAAARGDRPMLQACDIIAICDEATEARRERDEYMAKIKLDTIGWIRRCPDGGLVVGVIAEDKLGDDQLIAEFVLGLARELVGLDKRGAR